MSEFKTFPFSLRQLKDERAGKVGIVECVRAGVVRQYEVVADKDNEPVARIFSTVGTCLHLRLLYLRLLRTDTNTSLSHHQERSYNSDCTQEA